MKIFLKKISLFILPIFILAYPVDVIISNNLKKSVTHAQHEYPVWNDIYNRNIHDSLIIIGNSRARGQVSPFIIEDKTGISSYNMGMDGQNFELQYLRWKEYKKNHVPKYVISIVDIFFLSENKGIYNAEQFLPYTLLNKEYDKYILGKNYFEYLDLKIPLIRYYGKYQSILVGLKSMNKKDNNHQLIKGYYPEEASWKPRSISPYHVKIDEKIKNIYLDFIKECTRENIKVIMVYPPEHFTSKGIILNKPEIITILKEIAVQNKLEFIDFSSWALNKDTTIFYNVTHLNKKGAVLFSNMLGDSLKVKL